MTVNTMHNRADIGTRFLAILIDSFVLGLIAGLLVGYGREAGGIVSDLSGQDKMLEEGAILCANSAIHKSMLGLLQDVRSAA